MDKIGITEAGEVAFNLDVFDRLYEGNIIITKRLSDKVIEKLVEYKDKIILHLDCTGFGGSVVEPFVPTVEQTYEKFKTLIGFGFPLSHVVLRIDPVIPTNKGIEVARKVLEVFRDTGIPRIRFSVLDMYNHVKDRFKEAGFPIPYETFHAPYEVRLKIYEMFKSYGADIETCAEPGFPETSCLSQKDIDILGLRITLEGSKGQRKNCGCPANKTELIKGKPHQCEHKCTYCFWKDGV